MNYSSPASDRGGRRQRVVPVALLLLATSAFTLLNALTTQPSSEGSISHPDDLAAMNGDSKSIVHGLINLEFSNYHLTSRGLNLQNQGLITQPYLRLDWTLYQTKPKSESSINEVTFTTAVWNDVDTVKSGAIPGHWNEIDPTIGPNIRFLKDWTFESPFTAYISETGSFPTCVAWIPRLTYHDHFIKDFSFNPYVEFFDDLQNKVTVVFNHATSRTSYYGVIGFDPTYAFEQIPLKLELPTYCIIPGQDFYQRKNGTGGGTDLALFSTTLKATIPLRFIPPAYGKWSAYAGVQYDYLNNPGLLDGNQFDGAAKSRERNLVVFHGGLTVHF